MVELALGTTGGLNSSARKMECELWILEVMDGLRKGWMLVKRKNCSEGCFTCENMKEYSLKVEMSNHRRDFSWVD